VKLVKSFTWSIVPGVGVMQVDNVNANDLDLSGLPGTFMVEWREGRGEIETTAAPGLRTIFYDVTPYAFFFRMFMAALNTGGTLTLTQAQKIQTDLISCLFDTKRQAPISFTPAGGTAASYSADDTEMAALCLNTIPFIVGSTTSGSTSLVAQINAMIDNINTGIVNTLNANASIHNFNYNTCNADLRSQSIIGGGFAASPGLPGTAALSLVNTVTTLAHIAGAGAGSANVPWSPIGATAPILLTLADTGNLASAVATRRQGLLNTHNNKRAAVNALATIPAVIAYDVTAGW
jgi:hypothetical protein